MTPFGSKCFGVFVIVTIILVIKPISNTQFTHDRKRIGPLDLVMAEQNCLKKFTVNENTIIRTQDSRLLGAKFLNESDIGNREDCLTFCCNTKYCDVAVFQEKSPFSCYLFDCGPPEDFLCKFTSHSYYTSAVLAVNRHQLDLGVWSSQYQHEAELTDLRFTSDNIKSINQQVLTTQSKNPTSEEVKPKPTEITAYPTTLPTTSATTKAPSTSISTKSSSSESQNVPGRKCSNFQFECHHSGECIAIYNACDGIPQCKDGSDEAKQLGCPPDVSSAITANESESSKANGRNAVYNEEQFNPQLTNRRKYGPERGIFNHRTNFLEYNHNPNDRSPDYAREESLGYGGHGKGPGGYYDYDQRQVPVPKYNLGRPEVMKGESPPLYHHDYPDYSLINRQREIQPLPSSHQHPQLYQIPMNQQMQSQHRSGTPQAYQQDDLSNKGQWQGPNQQYAPSYQGVPQNIQPRLPHYEGNLQGSPPVKYDPARDMLQQQQPSRFENSRVDSQQQYNSPLLNTKMGSLASNAAEGPKISAHAQRIQAITNVPEQEDLSKTTMENNVDKSEPQKTPLSSTHPVNNTKSPSNDSGPRNNVSKETKPEEAAEGEKKTAIASKTKEADPVAAHASLSRLSVNIEELEREDENQKSQTSGAILALSLGMSITALLIVLVVCKIRKVKKRVRRRRGLRSPLEHDVDYLVNGMYL